VIEALAPTVSVSWFAWWKEPDNSYITIFPTATIPPIDDERALRAPHVGQAIFDELVVGKHRPVTVAMYGGGGDAIFVPWVGDGVRVWPPPRRTARLPRLPRNFASTPDGRERTAVRLLLRALDVAWLRRRGEPDPVTSKIVLDWTDDIIRALEDWDEARLHSPFDDCLAPFNLWRVKVDVRGVLGLRRDIWWSGRHRVAWSWATE
jgi:hypothetical protein